MSRGLRDGIVDEGDRGNGGVVDFVAVTNDIRPEVLTLRALKYTSLMGCCVSMYGALRFAGKKVDVGG